jgi:hypothetical protein
MIILQRNFGVFIPNTVKFVPLNLLGLHRILFRWLSVYYIDALKNQDMPTYLVR